MFRLLLGESSSGLSEAIKMRAFQKGMTLPRLALQTIGTATSASSTGIHSGPARAVFKRTRMRRCPTSVKKYGVDRGGTRESSVGLIPTAFVRETVLRQVQLVGHSVRPETHWNRTLRRKILRRH